MTMNDYGAERVIRELRAEIEELKQSSDYFENAAKVMQEQVGKYMTALEEVKERGDDYDSHTTERWVAEPARTALAEGKEG